jgi:hypothetical protein
MLQTMSRPTVQLIFTLQTVSRPTVQLNFTLQTVSIPLVGSTQPPVQWTWEAPPLRQNVRGIKLKLRRRIKKLKLKLPSSAEIKSAWSYTSIIPFAITIVINQALGQRYVYFYLTLKTFKNAPSTGETGGWE